MSLFEKIMGRKHASATWQSEPGLEMELDLERHSFCSRRLGDPIEWLSGLGPPEDSEALREQCFRYYSRGIEIGEDNGKISDFTAYWIDYLQLGFQPFNGSVTYRCKTVHLDSRTTEGDFVKVFGAPYWRDQDQDETILFYEFRDDIEWQVEFTLESGLKAIRVVRPALMADPEQREHFGVSLPWPPRRE